MLGDAGEHDSLAEAPRGGRDNLITPSNVGFDLDKPLKWYVIPRHENARFNWGSGLNNNRFFWRVHEIMLRTKFMNIRIEFRGSAPCYQRHANNENYDEYEYQYYRCYSTILHLLLPLVVQAG